jgi:hypothetical protein
MSAAVVCLTLLVCAILAWSGVAKLRAPGSVDRAMRQLRVPAPLAGRPLQRAIPWAEILLALALLLLSGPWAVAAWAAALALFMVYLVLITRAAAQPIKVSCNCFGLTSAPVTKWTVARNALLATSAVVGLVTALTVPSSALGHVVALDASGWMLVFVVALIGATAFALGRDFAGGTAPEPGPSNGSSAIGGDAADASAPTTPSAVVEREPGRPLLLSDLAIERPALLLYLSPTCASCGQIAERLPAWAARVRDVDVVVVAQSWTKVEWLDDAVRAFAVVDVARSVAMSLGMPRVPAAAVLSPDGVVADGPVAGPEGISALMDRLSSLP